MNEVGVVATIVTSLALAGVGVVIASSQLNNKKLNVSGAWFFVVTCFALATWLLANILSDADPDRALVWVRVSFASIAIGLTCLHLFVNRFPTQRFVSLRETGLSLGALGLILFLICTPLIIPTVTFEDGISTVVPGSLYGIFVAFVVGILSVILLRLFQGTKLSKRYRVQVQIILIGVLITAVVAVLTNLLLPLLVGDNNLYWLASVSTLAFVFATAYAIIKEGLFDVRLAVMRSVTYVMSLISIIGIYYLTVLIIAHSILRNGDVVNAAISPLALLPAIILTLTFQPVKQFFDKFTNKLFFRDRYKSEEFFAQFSQLLASTTDLRNLLERASHKISDTFKSEQVFFHVYYADHDAHHISVGTPKHAKIPPQDAELLDSYTRAHQGEVILIDFLGDHTMQKMLRSHRIALVMPLFQGDRIMGYLMLGDHRSGYYTKRDLTVLSGITNGLIVAIQNALSLHEVRALNATLQQRIDVATKELRSSNAQLKHLDEVKDEFISMASHQLRTPLTSVKGYLSMMIDGDVGKVTQQQQKVLSEAYNSSERMVRLISDFLNVSRLQTGKFVIEKTTVDFTRLIEQEAANLRIMAETRKIEVELSLPKHHVIVNADESKIREVIMNFIDNAIYYSPGESTVKIKLKVTDDTMAFTVKDQGIGVPEADQARLFHRFFRASNARKQRPDGTGVGLYLARKVIAAHGGKIIFESIEGKGSTFGFSLPVRSIQLDQ